MSSYIPPNPIVIIDSFNYMKVQEIHQQGYIVQRSLLSLLDEESFVYAYEGNVVQISTKTYGIMFKSNTEKLLNRWGGILTLCLNNEKYLIVESNHCELEVVKLLYE